MTPRTLVLVKALVFLAVAGVCVLASRRLAGERGLLGAGIGAGAAFLVVALGHWILLWERRGTRRGLYVAAYGSAAVGLAGLVLTALIVGRYGRDLVSPAILTLFFAYFSCRMVDAAQAALGTGRSATAPDRTEGRT
ncbi:MAG: hypothetical protein ACUVYA_03705 [Planctomycetota bacterium]